jgi:hypothetical protein
MDVIAGILVFDYNEDTSKYNQFCQDSLLILLSIGARHLYFSQLTTFPFRNRSKNGYYIAIAAGSRFASGLGLDARWNSIRQPERTIF